MAQYIDKDALVAEIEKKLKNVNLNYISAGSHPSATDTNKKLQDGISKNLQSLLSYIDTLEVKEVDLLTEGKTEKELAESYINLFDKKFGNKLPNLKGKQLAEFKNLINTCEQTFYMKYFDYHATQGKLFEKLALLWAAWGKEHLRLEMKEVDLEEEINHWQGCEAFPEGVNITPLPKAMDIVERTAKHFFELGLNAQKGE